MLPPRHRMRRSEDFTDAVRGGARSGTRTVVVHLREPTSAGDKPALVGLVVSKAVGNAVERTQVKRRLRGVMASRMTGLAAGEMIVLRALPAARDASSAVLAADVDTGLSGARRRLARRGASR
ncbi:ribonuclease P protein component [Georgenia sunbinii]|uniref:ribonuclease P protein component n=1 Tax=Georgenia sunbinii TaxID=3117728 RepID=UPI002F261A08